jgi:hypothetical protein
MLARALTPSPKFKKTMDRWVNAINLGISPGFLISDFRAVVRLDFENVGDPMLFVTRTRIERAKERDGCRCTASVADRLLQDNAILPKSPEFLDQSIL